MPKNRFAPSQLNKRRRGLLYLDENAVNATPLPPMPPTLMGPSPRPQPGHPGGPRPRPQKPPALNWQDKAELLGRLSRSEEAAEGPWAVSSGRTNAGPDRGGVSYGSWQLATNWGRPAEFLLNEGRPWANRFNGLTPGSPEFSAVWRLVATETPEAFERAQRAFIRRTDYEVQLRRLRGKTGQDFAAMGPAMRDVVWSTAVQHGRNTDVISDAYQALGMDPRTPGYRAALINKIYEERARQFPTTAPRFDRERLAALRALTPSTDRKPDDFKRHPY